MGARRIRKAQRRVDMKISRITNGMLKTKERVRRHQLLTAKVKAGKLPYTPTVLSWLSEELNKPGRLITQEDVNQWLAKA